MVVFSNFKLTYSSKHFKEKGKIVERGSKLSFYKEANIRSALVVNYFSMMAWKTTHGHHQMVNTEIRLIIFFAAKDGEALYSQ